MRHRYLGGHCIFCGLPRATANYTSYDADGTAGGSPLAIECLHEEMPLPCPSGKSWALFYLAASLLVPLFLFWGWEWAAFYAVLLAIVARSAPALESSRWLGLAEVQDEYDKLVETLATGRKLFYLKHIDEVVKPILKARDRAFRIIPLVAEEPLPQLEMKMQALSTDLASTADPELKNMYQARARDLAESTEKIRTMLGFLEKFEAHKKSIASSLKLLRTKLLLAETTGDDREVQKTLEDLRSLHAVYEKVTETLGE